MSHQLGSFEIEQDGKIKQFDFLHTLRLWLFSDLQELIHRSGPFEIVAIYGEDFEELNDWERLSGELGNVYLTLLKIQAPF